MSPSPALSRYPDEAAIIGRIVVGFGGLEFTVCNIASLAFGATLANPHVDEHDVIFKTLYQLRVTSARIDCARTLMAPFLNALNLGDKLAVAMRAVRHCQCIRNQYAHCNWDDDPHGSGLYFTDPQDSARRDSWFDDWKHIDVALLQKQEAYFANMKSQLFYLEFERSFRLGLLSKNPYVQFPEN
jgi:hypothetical protein